MTEEKVELIEFDTIQRFMIDALDARFQHGVGHVVPDIVRDGITGIYISGKNMSRPEKDPSGEIRLIETGLLGTVPNEGDRIAYVIGPRQGYPFAANWCLESSLQKI